MVKAVKKDGTVEWEKYDLAEMRKSMSIVKIACELDVSDMAVRKRMKKLGIK
jgi:predicted ArsR family transcriptional regulator